MWRSTSDGRVISSNKKKGNLWRWSQKSRAKTGRCCQILSNLRHSPPAKRAPSPSKIAPALALQRAQVLAKIRVRRPHLHRRHRPTTAATMPQEVKQKSGIAIGLNKGHVRPPRNPPPHAIREKMREEDIERETWIEGLEKRNTG